MSPLRDPARTRAAILSAAESLFAEQGYELTSMQQIGEAAGYARTTPGYFFTSKADLYESALDRLAERAATAMAPAFAAARGGCTLAEVVAPLVASFIEFLAAEPTYVRLLQREALREEPNIERFVPAHALAQALAAVARVDGGDDPRARVIELFALCWFPYAHARTLLRALGLDPHARDFVEAHKQRVVAAVTR